MSWARGIDGTGREVGYAVPDVCNAPGCSALIDRGLDHRCGGAENVRNADHGCGGFFCHEHKGFEFCGRCGGRG